MLRTGDVGRAFNRRREVASVEDPPRGGSTGPNDREGWGEEPCSSPPPLGGVCSAGRAPISKPGWDLGPTRPEHQQVVARLLPAIAYSPPSSRSRLIRHMLRPYVAA